MASDIEEGEKALMDDADAEYRLRVRLGLERPLSSRQGKHPQENGKETPGETSKSKRKSRVGDRAPSRDQVKEEGKSDAPQEL